MFRNKEGGLTEDTKRDEVQQREYYVQLFGDKFENPEEREVFLVKYK